MVADPHLHEQKAACSGSNRPAGMDKALCKALPYRVTSAVPKIRLGGHIFIAWRSDHPPRHVHVYQKGGLR